MGDCPLLRDDVRSVGPCISQNQNSISDSGTQHEMAHRDWEQLTLAATAELALGSPVAGGVALAACLLARAGLEAAGLELFKVAGHGLAHGGEGHGGRGDEEDQGEAHVVGCLSFGLQFGWGLMSALDNRVRDSRRSLNTSKVKTVRRWQHRHCEAFAPKQPNVGPTRGKQYRWGLIKDSQLAGTPRQCNMQSVSLTRERMHP